MGAYSQQDKRAYNWLQTLFSNYNIDCADDETIIELFEEFDEASGMNTSEVLKVERPDWFDEDDDDDED